MALTFDESLVMGVAELDREHHELFARLDALLEAIRRGSSRIEVAHTLAYLREYVVKHFAGEERLMLAAGFPDRDRHLEEHLAFMRDFAGLEDEHRRDGATTSLVVRVNVWLAGWLREHMYRADRALGEFVKARAAP